MKEITVEYFALLRQEAEVEREVIKTRSTNLNELYKELREARGFSLSEQQVRAAINKKVVIDWKNPIADGDHILFIPPLVGG